MEIQTMEAGPMGLFEMMSFGRPDQNLLNQLKMENQQTQQMLMTNYGFDASEFFNSSQQSFNIWKQNMGLDMAEDMIAMGKVAVSNGRENNIFIPILHQDDFAKASIFQQTYLMSNPRVKTMYLDGQLDGYSATYNNLTGNLIGEDDPIYRMAISGLSRSSVGDLQDDMDEVYIEYDDDPSVVPNINRLSPIEQSNWIQAVHMQNLLLDEGLDPTSKNLDPVKELKKFRR